jgi:hypothetical protein
VGSKTLSRIIKEKNWWHRKLGAMLVFSVAATRLHYRISTALLLQRVVFPSAQVLMSAGT